MGNQGNGRYIVENPLMSESGQELTFDLDVRISAPPLEADISAWTMLRSAGHGR